MKTLDKEVLKKELQALEGWEFQEEAIKKTFSFKDHLGTLSFLNAVAFYSEKTAHHPHVSYCYNEATLSYQTHDAGNKVTSKDLAAAHYTNELVNPS